MQLLSLNVTGITARPCGLAAGLGSGWRRWSVVVLYALAMAWVEAAVVFYIRFHIDRLVPYQPDPLPEIGGFAVAEVVREFATLIMLATVGCLAGTTWRNRAAFALVAFGIWDIAYYVWLVPLTGWPRSILEWDILFLIPLPWWGPVWAPVSIATLMLLFGTAIAIRDSRERPLWPGWRSCSVAVIGAALALYVLMEDSLRAVFVEGSMTRLRSLLPQSFNWPLFVVALGFLATPVAEIFIRAWPKCSVVAKGGAAMERPHSTQKQECI